MPADAAGTTRAGAARRFSRAASSLPPAAGICLALASGGCGGATDAEASVTREVIGDTTIVRTAGYGPWGADAVLIEELRIGTIEGADEYMFGELNSMAVDEAGSMYVLDAQALEVRVYDAEGTFTQRIGRSGGGPGEFKRPGGVGFLPDGRLVVRDPGNARINVYSRVGATLDSWPIPGGFFTSAPIFIDDAGHVYTDIIAERREDGTFRTGLLRLDSTGIEVDTLRRPFEDYERPSLIAQNVVGESRSVSMTGVPFWPDALSTLNRAGEFVGGIADHYALTTWRADGTVQRIERDVARVPVNPDESATAVERTTRMMRNTQANWRWEGPRPPTDKPAFKQIRVGEDGRIWVSVSRPADRVPPDADAEPDAQGRRPLDRWIEPSVYDVYEPDGAFIGTVRFPERFQPMALRGDQVWGFIRDDYDVQYVTRWRVTPTR